MVVGSPLSEIRVIAANEIHIPAGTRMSIRLESADVLHEFWVAQLTRKMATVPDHPNHIWIQSDQPGTYLGVCRILRDAACMDAFPRCGGNAGAIRGLGESAAGAGEDSGERQRGPRARAFSRT